MSAESWMQTLRVRGSLPFLEDELPKQSRGPVLETGTDQETTHGLRQQEQKRSESKTRSMEIETKSMGFGI